MRRAEQKLSISLQQRRPCEWHVTQKGTAVSLFEVEEALNRHPSVYNCIVFRFPDSDMCQSLATIVEWQSTNDTSVIAELKRFLRLNFDMDTSMLPTLVLVCSSSLPTNLVRSNLSAQFGIDFTLPMVDSLVQRELAVEFVDRKLKYRRLAKGLKFDLSTRKEFEFEAVLSACQNILGFKPTLQSKIYDSGITSLNIVAFQRQLETATSKAFNMGFLLSNPSISMLVSHVTQAPEADGNVGPDLRILDGVRAWTAVWILRVHALALHTISGELSQDRPRVLEPLYDEISVDLFMLVAGATFPTSKLPSCIGVPWKAYVPILPLLWIATFLIKPSQFTSCLWTPLSCVPGLLAIDSWFLGTPVHVNKASVHDGGWYLGAQLFAYCLLTPLNWLLNWIPTPTNSTQCAVQLLVAGVPSTVRQLVRLASALDNGWTMQQQDVVQLGVRHAHFLRFSPFFRVPQFFAGMLLGRALASVKEHHSHAMANIDMPLLLLVMVAVSPFSSSLQIILVATHDLYFPVILFFAATTRSHVSTLLASQTSAQAARFALAVYLFQFPVIGAQGAPDDSRAISWFWYYISIFSSTFVLAIAVTLFFYEPLQRAVNRCSSQSYLKKKDSLLV